MEKPKVSFEEMFIKWLSNGEGISYNEHVENIKSIRNKYQKEFDTNEALSEALKNKIIDLISNFDETLRNEESIEDV